MTKKTAKSKFEAPFEELQVLHPAPLKRALKWLKIRDYFQDELENRLLSAGFELEAVIWVIQFLLNRRFLDDQRTIDNLLVRYSGANGVGRNKLRAMLIERCAPEELVEHALEEYERSQDHALLRAWIKQKFESKGMAAASRHLASRGFDEDEVESIASSVFGSEVDSE